MRELHWSQRSQSLEALCAQDELLKEVKRWEVRIQECLAESRAIDEEITRRAMATKVVEEDYFCKQSVAQMSTEVIRPKSLTETSKILTETF